MVNNTVNHVVNNTVNHVVNNTVNHVVNCMVNNTVNHMLMALKDEYQNFRTKDEERQGL